MRKQVKFIANKNIGGNKIGHIFTLECDHNNTPLDSYWFRRFKDSKIDNCISIYKEPSNLKDTAEIKESIKKEEKEEKIKK